MSIPTPKRVAVVIYSLVRQRARALPAAIVSLAWVLPRLPYLLRSIHAIKNAVRPAESTIRFFFQMRRFQNLYARSDYIQNFRSKNIVSDEAAAAQSSTRPIIYLSWHHGAGRIEELSRRADPQAYIFSAYSFTTPRTLPADHQALVKMSKILAAGGRLVITFDGQFGQLDLENSIFGVPQNLSSSFLYLIKLHNPVCIPMTFYAHDTGEVDIFYGPDLNASGALTRREYSDGLQHVLEYFTQDFLAHGSYQIDYRFLLYPERIKLLPW